MTHHQGAVNAVAISEDGQFVLTGCADGIARLFDTDTGVLIHELTGHLDAINAVAFTPDSLGALTGSDDSSSRIFDLATGEQLACMSTHEPVARQHPSFFQAVSTVLTAFYPLLYLTKFARSEPETHSEMIASCALSPDGKLVVAGSYDDCVRIFDAHTSALISQVAHDASVRSIAIHPGGELFAAGDAEGVVTIRSVSTLEPTITLPEQILGIHAIDFSADGNRIIIACGDRRLRIYETHSGTLVSKIKGHGKAICSATLDQSGHLAASSSSDRTARLWDVDAGQEIARMIGHHAAVKAVAMTNDASRIVTGSVDRTARVWNANAVRSS